MDLKLNLTSRQTYMTVALTASALSLTALYFSPLSWSRVKKILYLGSKTDDVETQTEENSDTKEESTD